MHTPQLLYIVQLLIQLWVLFFEAMLPCLLVMLYSAQSFANLDSSSAFPHKFWWWDSRQTAFCGVVLLHFEDWCPGQEGSQAFQSATGKSSSSCWGNVPAHVGNGPTCKQCTHQGQGRLLIISPLFLCKGPKGSWGGDSLEVWSSSHMLPCFCTLVPLISTLFRSPLFGEHHWI